ncbi:hypothetical protein [Adlercreutzia sp. ZJ304]|uniref:hypothetical protein n=1 Tax=Adlercreutzia sp. ZJ304 TaxID=2709791 RepID=UPI0013ED39F6|nr:hypothetical protein [Adlercreutzia sp. ZJ304]
MDRQETVKTLLNTTCFKTYPECAEIAKGPKKLSSVAMVIIRIFAAFLLLLGIIQFYIGFNSISIYVSAVAVVIASLIIVILSRKNALTLLLSVMICFANYSAIVANYHPSFSGFETEYAGTHIAHIGTLVLLVFVSSILLFFPKHLVAVEGSFFSRFPKPRSPSLFLLITVIMLLIIWITCSSGFTRVGSRAWNNEIYEYAYLLFLLAIYFGGKNRLCRIIIIMLAALYVSQALLGGNRAAILAIILLFFAIYFSKKITFVQMLSFLMGGFIIFMIFGAYRVFPHASISDIPQILVTLANKFFVWDTAAYAYHQSLCYIDVLEHISNNEHFYLVQQWLASIFLGGSIVPDSRLAVYAASSTTGMGGGFLPFYGFFYFGLIGIITSGLVVSVSFDAIGFLFRSSSIMYSFLSLCVFSTCMRWYLYSPAPLTRGILLAIFLYAGVFFFVLPGFSSRSIHIYNRL